MQIPSLKKYWKYYNREIGKKMKKGLFLFLSFIFIISCSEDNLQEQLRKKEAERNALNAEIAKLKKQISGQGSDQNDNLIDVVVTRVYPKLFAHYIKIQGMVESDNNILIPAQSSGVVKKIHVKEGQWVKNGQLLAELDGAILENTLAEINVNLNLAQTVFDRQKRLWEKNIGSEVQYLQAKTNLEALKKRKAVVEEQYRLTKVISPINGTVDEIFLKEGEAIAAGFGAIRVVEISKLKIKAELSEDYTGKIKPGDPVEVSIPVTSTNFSTSIRSVSRVIDPKNRTFPLEISIPRGIKDIKPNMLAVLTINDYKNPEALSIPVNSIQKSNGESFIFVAKQITDENSNKWVVKRRTIEATTPYGEYTEVVSGLNTGEFVVIQGFQDLADGQEVKVHE
jgi:RND family efflux transporter MFP subunit